MHYLLPFSYFWEENGFLFPCKALLLSLQEVSASLTLISSYLSSSPTNMASMFIFNLINNNNMLSIIYHSYYFPFPNLLDISASLTSKYSSLHLILASSLNYLLTHHSSITYTFSKSKAFILFSSFFTSPRWLDCWPHPLSQDWSPGLFLAHFSLWLSNLPCFFHCGSSSSPHYHNGMTHLGTLFGVLYFTSTLSRWLS